MIRSATANDLAAIIDLIRALADYEKLSHLVAIDEARLRAHLFGPKPFAEVLLADHETEVVGFALFFPNYSTFLAKPGIYLEDLFVKPTHRGQGHGKALFEAVTRIADERDCGRVEWAVLNWNQPAIDFYRSYGAVAMEEWTTFRLAANDLHKKVSLKEHLEQP